MNTERILNFFEFVANNELDPGTPIKREDLLELPFGRGTGSNYGSVIFNFFIFDEESNIVLGVDRLCYERYNEILAKGNIDHIYVHFSGARSDKNFSLFFRSNTIKGDFENYIEVTEEMIDKAKLACLKQIEMVLDKKKRAQKFQRVG